MEAFLYQSHCVKGAPFLKFEFFPIFDTAALVQKLLPWPIFLGNIVGLVQKNLSKRKGDENNVSFMR